MAIFDLELCFGNEVSRYRCCVFADPPRSQWRIFLDKGGLRIGLGNPGGKNARTNSGRWYVIMYKEETQQKQFGSDTELNWTLLKLHRPHTANTGYVFTPTHLCVQMGQVCAEMRHSLCVRGTARNCVCTDEETVCADETLTKPVWISKTAVCVNVALKPAGEPGGHSSPHQPYCWDSAGISVTQKHGFWSVFFRSVRFFAFPLNTQQAPSFVYWLVDRRSRNDFEVTSSWLYPWWSGPPKLQPWSSARTATTDEKTRRVVLGGMLLGNRVLL